jgi:hypothetical protein
MEWPRQRREPTHGFQVAAGVLSLRMANPYVLGLLYFAAVFAFAFLMGVARELVIAPRLGAVGAVVLEVQFVIAVSWLVARRLLRDRPVTLVDRAIMGVTAFSLLMACEATLSTIMRRQRLLDWANAVVSPLGLVGLFAQILFAAMPMLLLFHRIDVTPSKRER